MSIKEQEKKKMLEIVIDNEYDPEDNDAEWIVDVLQKKGYGNVPAAIDRFVKKLNKRMGIAYDSTIVEMIAKEFKEAFKK